MAIKETRTSETFVCFQHALNKVSTVVFSFLAESNLNNGQFDMLKILYKHGPLHRYELAKKIQRSNASISQLTDSLEKRNFVKKVFGVAERTFLVSLTPTGKQFIQRKHAEYQKKLTLPWKN